MHPRGFILEQDLKIKDYLSSINRPVKTNKTASKYSIFFFIFTSVTNLLKPLPNNAHKLIVGKHIIAAVIVTAVAGGEGGASAGGAGGPVAVATVAADRQRH